MAKRQIDTSSDDLYADPAEIIKGKKLASKKKTAMKAGPSTSCKPIQVDDDEVGSIAFDEVLQYKEDSSAKYNKIIRMSPEFGMGILDNKVEFFRIVKKNEKESISGYKFGFKFSVVPNAIKAMQKALLERSLE
jgi:hypothetical protein